MCWDRSGAVVSQAIDYRADSNLLCQFLWRFGNMTDAQRGFDVGIEAATREEEELFKAVVASHVEDQLGESVDDVGEQVAFHYEPGKVVKIPVRVRPDDTEEVVFLMCRPVVFPMSITRGYWAVNTVTKGIGFLNRRASFKGIPKYTNRGGSDTLVLRRYRG